MKIVRSADRWHYHTLDLFSDRVALGTMKCALCPKFFTNSIQVFVYYCKLHRNVPNFDFSCDVANCGRRFKTFAALRSHIHRDHIQSRKQARKKTEMHGSVTCGYRFVHSRHHMLVISCLI